MNKLEKLSLFKCSFKSFKSESFRFTPNIESLLISKPADFVGINFGELPYLKTLSLKSFPFGDLSFLDKLSVDLEVLCVIKPSVLKKNDLEKFFKRIVENNSCLKALRLKDFKKFEPEWVSKFIDLRHFQINNQCFNDFGRDFLFKLDSLYMESATLEQTFFDRMRLTNLKSLKLTHLDGMIMTDGLFASLSNLEVLSINITEFSGGFVNKMFLYGLKKLTRLNLTENYLGEIHPDVFKHTPNLTHLVLCANDFREIRKQMLAHLPKLQVLDVSENFVRGIEDGTFSNLKSLTYLSVFANRFDRISARTFDGLESLVELKLAIKRLEPINSFDQLKNLKFVKLNMDENEKHMREILDYYGDRIAFQFSFDDVTPLF